MEKQQKTLNKQKELNQQTRDNYLLFLDKQQKELGAALREVAERQRAVIELETTIQDAQSPLQSYVQETQQKALDLTKLEVKHKELTEAVKAEQKVAKNL